MAGPNRELDTAKKGNGAASSKQTVASTTSSSAVSPSLRMPAKQKMAVGFKSLLDSAKKLAIGGGDGSGNEKKLAEVTELFPKVKPEVDGEDCIRDCDTCVVHYPRGFKIDEEDVLYGFVKGWSTHVLVATGKTDWVRDVADEKGSVMQAIGNSKVEPSNGVCCRTLLGH